jgi:hypothetical protein
MNDVPNFPWYARPLLWIFWLTLEALAWIFGPWSRAKHETTTTRPARAATDEDAR